MARKLVVEIVGDASSLDRSFKKAGDSAKKFDNQMGAATRGGLAAAGAFKGMGRSLAFASGGFLSGAAITAGLKSSVSAASDLEQQIGKTNVVFGESAAAVQEWSQTLADSFGLSRREALDTASSFGALFAPIGLTGEAAAEQSRKLTELGADLASFYNTDVASALDAIRSGLVGESEPLRRYGVLLSETRVQQEALNQTGKKSAENLTAQEKVLARVSLIYKDSKQAQGDFARTSDQAAQQAKILKANLENLSATIGAALLPKLNAAVTELNDFFRALSGPTVEGGVRGEGVETTLVPLMAKRIAALKKAGVSAKEQLRILREMVGDSQKANDLIAEAFRFAGDRALRARLRRQKKEAEDALKEMAVVVDPNSPGRRKAREAVRQQAQDQAQLAVDRTALTQSVADDIAALERLNNLLKRRIAGGHNTIEMQRQQLQVELQLQALVRQQAENRKAAREAAAEAAREARDARQFRLLGFGPTGEELIPGVKNLRKQLASVGDAIAGSFLDTRKTRGLLGHIRQVLAGGLGSVSSEVRARIQQILADLRNQLKQSSVDVTRFQATASGQLTLAGAHPRVGQGITIQGGIHLHGVQSVQEMEEALAKRRKQRARQRRSTR